MASATEGEPLLARPSPTSRGRVQTQEQQHGAPASASAFWSIYDTPSLTQSRFDWKSPVLTILAVLGQSGENTSLPLWIGTFGPALGGPYFILLFASICFTIAFTVLALVHSVFYRCEWPVFKEHWKIFVAIGFVDAVNGLLLVYASPMSRTPPLLQALLPAMGIVFGLLSTRLLVSRRDSPISYTRWPAILSLALVLFGIVFALVPMIRSIVTGKSGFSHGGAGLGIVWSLVFTSAMIPGALYQVTRCVVPT
jgi:CRT-like, chloroquine-resistance transporter-like